MAIKTFIEPFFGTKQRSDTTPITFEQARVVARKFGIDLALLLAFANHESRLKAFSDLGPLLNHVDLEHLGTQKARYDAITNRLKQSEVLTEFNKTAFGMGQIMGKNYKLVATSPIDFINQVFESAVSQLTMIAKFINATPALKQAVAQRNWAMIANLYAGAKWKIYYPKFVDEMKHMVEFYDNLLKYKPRKS